MWWVWGGGGCAEPVLSSRSSVGPRLTPASVGWVGMGLGGWGGRVCWAAGRNLAFLGSQNAIF